MTLISVRPADLWAAGADVRDAAALITEAVQRLDTVLTIDTRGSGFASRELIGVGRAWFDYLHRLRDGVDAIGGALAAAAESYAAAEWEADRGQLGGYRP